MNFLQVRQAMGQKDPVKPQYDLKIDMFGVLVQCPAQAKYNQRTGKPSMGCTIRDDNGEVQKVYFIGQNFPNQALQGQRIAMSLSAYTSQNTGNTGYSGFWNANQQVNQQQSGYPQQASPQLPPQRPQARPGSTIPPQQGPTPDWDAIARGKVRNGLVVADRQQGRSWFQVLDPQNVKEIEIVVEYISTGQVGLIPTDDGDGPDYGPQDNPGDFSWDSPASDDDAKF